MKYSITKHRKVLISDGEMGRLEEVIQQLKASCSRVQIYKASNYNEGLQRLLCLSFDLVVSDFDCQARDDLLDLALDRHVPVLVILNGKKPPPEFLRRVNWLKVETPFSYEDVEKVAYRIERLLARQCLPGWRRLVEAMARLPVLAVVRMTPREPGTAWPY